MTQEAEKFPEGRAKSGKRKTAQEKPVNPIPSFEEVEDKVSATDPLANVVGAADKAAEGAHVGTTSNTKPATNPTPEDIFNDIAALRKVSEHKVQRRVVPVNMSVRKPPDNAYFQCHPDLDQRLDTSLVFDKEERDVYYVGPTMLNDQLLLPRLRRVTIATVYLWPSGQIHLWPVPFPKGRGSVKCWKTARRAFEIACGLVTDLDPPGPRWVQLCWNDATQDYDLAVAENISTTPIWPADLQLSNSLKLGFRDKTIVDVEHPYMRQLRGLTE
jgi:hypothetical protein